MIEDEPTGERISSRCICCDGTALERSPAILMPFVANRVFGWEPVEITPDWGLRDIRSGMAYPLCNSVQCTGCGALFLDIRFSEAEMGRLYIDYRGEAYTRLRDRFEPGYAARNEVILDASGHTPRIEAFLSRFMSAPHSVLDWGGDTGLNTPFGARSRNFHVFDISDKPAIPGAVRVDKATIHATDYDLIVLSHVLEHLPSPARAVAEIRTVMKPHTVLYVEVPHEELVSRNPDSKSLHAKKRHWHEHVNFFTRDSLHALLEGCGLKVIDMLSIAAGDGDVKSWQVFSIACRVRQAQNS